MHHVRGLDVRAKRRVGKDNVEAALKDAVHIEKAVVVMNTAVAVTVHDHVHLAGAGHAVISVSAIDAAVSELPQARITLALVEGGMNFSELVAQRFGFFVSERLFLIQRQP